MEYIRVQHGLNNNIYELQDDGTWTKNGKPYLNKLNLNYAEFQKYIVKKGDTIAELCDYFAFDDTLQDSTWDLQVRLDAQLFTSKTWAMIQSQRQDRVIIGYIVIERKGVKTLEPVARGKGELELL